MNAQINLPAWVQQASQLPLAFAQVREDPWLDLWTLEKMGRPARVLMIASGGCTAAALAASGRVAHLHLVDVNPAQLALVRLKLRMLHDTDPQERLALLGHAPMPETQRTVAIGRLLADFDFSPEKFGPTKTWCNRGLDYAGRYECVFAELQNRLEAVQPELIAVLSLHDPVEQARKVSPETSLGQTITEALHEVMSQQNLVALFGERATRNRVEPFADHFARRIFIAFATLPAANNPFLWQMLLGRFPDGIAYPWFAAKPAAAQPDIACTRSEMLELLRTRPGTYDYVHLSNILDWLSVEEAEETLARAAAILMPGGWTLIRQLNSTLDVPKLGPAFDWHTSLACQWHGRDRSFFYRALHLGQKR